MPKTAPVVAGVDHPLIRVNQATSAGGGRCQSAENTVCTTHAVSARSRIAQPTNCLENRSIRTARHNQSACVRMSGDIAPAGRVQLSRLELPIAQVGGCGTRGPTTEAGFAAIVHLGTQPIGAHQSMYPIATATLTRTAQIVSDLAMPRRDDQQTPCSRYSGVPARPSSTLLDPAIGIFLVFSHKRLNTKRPLAMQITFEAIVAPAIK